MSIADLAGGEVPAGHMILHTRDGRRIECEAIMTSVQQDVDAMGLASTEISFRASGPVDIEAADTWAKAAPRVTEPIEPPLGSRATPWPWLDIGKAAAILVWALSWWLFARWTI
jgi:hypothetical protein